MSKQTKVLSDGFVYKIVTDSAKELFSSGAISLYVLHDDDSESLVECREDIDMALENGLPIGISVGIPYTTEQMMEKLKSDGYCTDDLWHTIDVTSKYNCTFQQAQHCLSWALMRVMPDIHESIESYMETYLNIKPNTEQ